MTAATVDVSIIIVSYNTCAMTLACLDSIAAETKAQRYEVLVVDNNSTDGSAEAIEHHPSRPTLIRAGGNLGFARANNLAALQARGRLLLLLNPDTVVREQAIDRLVAFSTTAPQARIWGGRTLFADGRLNPSSCWRRMTPWNLLCRLTGMTAFFPRSELFNGEAYGGWQRNTVRQVDIVSGCFLLIERGYWQGLGGFDPAFYMYGEEADLCLRARQRGARPMVTPEATIVHYGGASERTRTAKMVKLLAAKALLITRHWPASLAWLGRALLAAWPLSRWIALAFAGAITGRTSHIDAAATWREVWAQRHAWRHGYADPVGGLERVASTTG